MRLSPAFTIALLLLSLPARADRAAAEKACADGDAAIARGDGAGA
ncbi:MAG: hypothetical protein FD180_4981, partial [Planctomycetota bacterium]